MSRACPHSLLAVLAALCAASFAGTAPAGAVSFAGSVPAAAAQDCPSASAMPSQVERAPLVDATLCLLNEQRDRRGLAPLRSNARLADAAQRHARDMAKRNYFSHTSPTGATFIDRIRRTGYLDGARSWHAAENIAWGTGRLATPRSIVKGWMNSPGHRANILNGALREIGIGVAEDAPIDDAGSGGTYATDFGTRS